MTEKEKKELESQLYTWFCRCCRLATATNERPCGPDAEAACDRAHQRIKALIQNAPAGVEREAIKR